MSTSIVSKCVDDLLTKIKTLTVLKNKVHHVYTEAELNDKTKGFNYPLVAVVYDGTSAVPGGIARGLSVEINISIMLFFKAQAHATANQTLDAVDLLDEVRNTILDTVSPSGHKWKFKAEVGSQGDKGVYVYMQRWAAPAQLV